MRLTKKYMLEDYPRLERKVELLDLYLFDIQNGRDPDETEIHFNIRGQLFRAPSPTGGYVVIYHTLTRDRRATRKLLTSTT